MLGWFAHGYEFVKDAQSATIVRVLVTAIRLGLLGNMFTYGYSPTFRELLVGLERFRHDCIALRRPVALRRHPVTLHQHLNVPSRLCPLHLPIGRDDGGEPRRATIRSRPCLKARAQASSPSLRNNPRRCAALLSSERGKKRVASDNRCDQ